MQEALYWLGFSFFHGIGPTKFQLLLDQFWTAENAWNATELELTHSGIGKKVTQDFLEFRRKFDPKVYAETLEKADVTYLLSSDPLYPQLLKEIKSPPFILYVRGDRSLLAQERKYVAVVGTRKITDYGRHVTEALVTDLASMGCIIVSGLAMGVDAVAHAATLRAGGKTVAVLGCGVDCCTPRENEALYHEIIAAGGTIISEAPLSQPSFKGSFPSRNRIIAGLCQGVLVTEGAEDSGSLITANDALKNNRMVFAVPGPITSSVSRGPIALIANGAKMVVSANDVLTQLGMQSNSLIKRKESIKADTKEEQCVLDILLNEQLHFDELVKRTGLVSSQLGTILTLMEMKGWVTNTDSGAFTIAV